MNAITDEESDTLEKMITAHGIGEIVKEIVYIMVDLELDMKDIAKVF